jgi:ankyrin repeat protein
MGILKKFAVLALAISLFAGNYAAAEAESPSESLRLYLNSGNGDPNVVKRFIEQGADVNIRDEYLITPLHNAIHYKHTEAAKVLISHGADVNAKNVEGNTPLYVAVHQKLEEITGILRKECRGARKSKSL